MNDPSHELPGFIKKKVSSIICVKRLYLSSQIQKFELIKRIIANENGVAIMLLISVPSSFYDKPMAVLTVQIHPVRGKGKKDTPLNQPRSSTQQDEALEVPVTGRQLFCLYYVALCVFK